MGESDPFHIPWAPEIPVEVESEGGRNRLKTLRLHSDGATATIFWNGDVVISNHWEQKIHKWMHKDEESTRDFRDYIESLPADERDDIAVCDWVLCRPRKENVPHGPKEWRPPARPYRHAPWTTEEWGVSTSFNRGFRTSRPFWYYHFMSAKGDGLVIVPEEHVRWQFALPEVWLGSVSRFFKDLGNISDQVGPADNEHFQNGILWAFDQFGLFEGSPRGGYHLPPWALEAIKNDPDLLWPELIEKLMPKLKNLLPTLQTAVLEWEKRHGRPS